MSRSIIKTLALSSLYSVLILSFEGGFARIPGARNGGPSYGTRGDYRYDSNRRQAYDPSYHRQRYQWDDNYRDGWRNRYDGRPGYRDARPGYSYGYDYPVYDPYYGQSAYSGYDYEYPPYYQQMKRDGYDQQMSRGGNLNQPVDSLEDDEEMLDAIGPNSMFSNPSSPSMVK